MFKVNACRGETFSKIGAIPSSFLPVRGAGAGARGAGAGATRTRPDQDTCRRQVQILPTTIY